MTEYTTKRSTAGTKPYRISFKGECRQFALHTMERKLKFLLKEASHLRNEASKPLTAATDHIEVVHIPAIMPTSERPLHVVIKPAEYLLFQP